MASAAMGALEAAFFAASPGQSLTSILDSYWLGLETVYLCMCFVTELIVCAGVCLFSRSLSDLLFFGVIKGVSFAMPISCLSQSNLLGGLPG